MEITDVLRKPMLSEKTTMVKEKAKQVVFMVHSMANKLEIKRAVEQVFDVKVEAVNTVRRASQNRERQGRVVGRKPGWKKAYITLRQGDTIELFEGV